MSISVLCCTYGRTRLLAMAVQSFILNLRNVPDAEMIIVNDNIYQRIIIEHTNIRIFNLDHRLETLGHKQNLANEIAVNEVRTHLDDDDIVMPWWLHNATMAAKMAGFYIGSSYLYSEGVGDNMRPVLMGKGPAGIPVYSREMWKGIGKIPLMNNAVDQETNRLMADYKKGNYTIPPGYLYRWGNGVSHMSGKTDGTEWERARVAFENNNIEPRGDVLIEPSWDIDYVAACKGPIDQWLADNPGHEDPRRPWADGWRPTIKPLSNEPHGMRRVGNVLMPAHLKVQGEKS